MDLYPSSGRYLLEQSCISSANSERQRADEVQIAADTGLRRDDRLVNGSGLDILFRALDFAFGKSNCGHEAERKDEDEQQRDILLYGKTYILCR